MRAGLALNPVHALLLLLCLHCSDPGTVTTIHDTEHVLARGTRSSLRSLQPDRAPALFIVNLGGSFSLQHYMDTAALSADQWLGHTLNRIEAVTVARTDPYWLLLIATDRFTAAGVEGKCS